jgi:hypothetical protein
LPGRHQSADFLKQIGPQRGPEYLVYVVGVAVHQRAAGNPRANILRPTPNSGYRSMVLALAAS